METRRKRHLPAGWYPESAAEAARTIEEWRARYPKTAHVFRACVAPHAGWGFSGALAFAAIQQLPQDVDTIAIVGGHLPSGSAVLVAPEDRYDTPFGYLTSDNDLREWLFNSVEVSADRLPDNTVEVHLPVVRHLFPQARGLYLRCPPSSRSSVVGEAVAEYARSSGRSVAVIGSTDLTHYGPDYGFEPKGAGEQALEWVLDVNDRLLIDALEDADTKRILEAGTRHKAACSAGAANAAAAFARAIGCTETVIVDHFTSHDVLPRASFVGYVGLGFECSSSSGGN